MSSVLLMSRRLIYLSLCGDAIKNHTNIGNEPNNYATETMMDVVHRFVYVAISDEIWTANGGHDDY